MLAMKPKDTEESKDIQVKQTVNVGIRMRTCPGVTGRPQGSNMECGMVKKGTMSLMPPGPINVLQDMAI